ncbi:MAG: hypothetical protein Q4B30_07015 [Coriobacteriaceae bacterium]|nr:hypothetical protein [Coriobacteriaceae bacterium]
MLEELFTVTEIRVGAKKLTARVRVNDGMPLRTSADTNATARVYYLAPAIAQHACLGDRGEHFQDCMIDTELAHLLEHVTVEIMIETGIAGRVVSGRTHSVPGDERSFDIELSCPDDALTVGALSSAAFMIEWAFLHSQTQPTPDFPGTVAALRQLVMSLRGEEERAAGEAMVVEGEPTKQVEESEEEEADMAELGAQVLFGASAANRYVAPVGSDAE